MGDRLKVEVRGLVVGFLAALFLAASSAAAEELSLPDRLAWAKTLLERDRSGWGRDGSDLIRLAIECEGQPQPVLVSVRKEAREARPLGLEIRRRGGGGVNTEYEVRSPAGCRVLALRYPIQSRRSAPRSVLYVPYSAPLHQPALIAAGLEYLEDLFATAYADLADRGVKSAAMPARPFADVVSPDLLRDLIIAEHIDPGLLRAHGLRGLAERVLVVLGANREEAYRWSRSSANARGLAQFIPSTYREVRAAYPRAGLLPDFEAGMADHRNAVQAMILLLDKHLATVGPGRLGTAERDVLAAAYNGGLNRATAALAHWGPEWAEGAGPRLQAVEQSLRDIEAKLRRLTPKKRRAPRSPEATHLARLRREILARYTALRRSSLASETVTYLVKIRGLASIFSATASAAEQAPQATRPARIGPPPAPVEIAPGALDESREPDVSALPDATDPRS